MTEILNMDERDPKQINNYVKASYADVIAESDVHSFDFIWKQSFYCFTGGRNFCYKFLSILCGMPIALMWGCLYAFFSFEMIWCVTPALQLLKMRIISFRAFYGMCLSTCLGPLYEIFALMFSNIRITLNSNNEKSSTLSPINAIKYQSLDNAAKSLV